MSTHAYIGFDPRVRVNTYLADKSDWPAWAQRDFKRRVQHWHADERSRAVLQSDAFSGELQRHILKGWDARYGRFVSGNMDECFMARSWLSDIVKGLRSARAHRAFDEKLIREYADNYAAICARMGMLTERELFALSLGVEPPAAESLTDRYEARAARLEDAQWWRRQLRTIWTRAAEGHMRRLGLIRKGRAVYASDSAVQYRAQAAERTAAFLGAHELQHEDGTRLDLAAVAEHSLANPALRRGEFMCRMRGFEELAAELGDVALFFTLTCPSIYHAYTIEGENPNHSGATVRDAQAWLRSSWAIARAALAKHHLEYYGFRVAEPHHDGTPHWHMVLFVPGAPLVPRAAGPYDRLIRWPGVDPIPGLMGPSESGPTLLTRALRAAWFREYADEPGAAEHRFKVEVIDRSKGSATGYLAKYVSKNIDGAGAIGSSEDHESGSIISDNVKRVTAWARIHGIRQFQQVGGPPVGIWRQARRARSACQDRDLERIRDGADHGSWHRFIGSLGASARGKLRHRGRGRTLRADSGRSTRYGEAAPPLIVGLRYAGGYLLTRPAGTWRLERKGVKHAPRPALRCLTAAQVWGALHSEFFAPLGPVAISVTGRSKSPPSYGTPAAWTSRETGTYGPRV